MKRFINELLYYGFKRNVYWLIHFIGGVVYAMVHLPFCKNFFHDPCIGFMYLILFILALGWEFYEYFSEGKEKIKKTYGGLKFFYYDSAGDIIVALIGAFIVSMF